jgi:hypothetical protein
MANPRYKQKMGEPPIFCLSLNRAESVTKITLESNSLGASFARRARKKRCDSSRLLPALAVRHVGRHGAVAGCLRPAGYCI